jgi:hypothetical protein
MRTHATSAATCDKKHKEHVPQQSQAKLQKMTGTAIDILLKF